MYRQAFPRCPVVGPVRPGARFRHGGYEGSVPAKCVDCEHLFEGDCTRGSAFVGTYLVLDHGPCFREGATNPVPQHSSRGSEDLSVPLKCLDCLYLRTDRILGSTCGSESETWGGFPRSLDWGTWSPKRPYAILPSPLKTNTIMVESALEDDRSAFIAAHRKANPGRAVADCIADYREFTGRLDALQAAMPYPPGDTPGSCAAGKAG